MRVSVGALPQEMHRSATLVQVCVCGGGIPTADAGWEGDKRSLSLGSAKKTHVLGPASVCGMPRARCSLIPSGMKCEHT